MRHLRRRELAQIRIHCRHQLVARANFARAHCAEDSCDIALAGIGKSLGAMIAGLGCRRNPFAPAHRPAWRSDCSWRFIVSYHLMPGTTLHGDWRLVRAEGSRLELLQ